MKRVMIIAGPGSGKSTLAVALARKLDLPVVDIGHIHLQPGWGERHGKCGLGWMTHDVKRRSLPCWQKCPARRSIELA